MKKYYFIAGLLIFGFLLGKSSPPSSNTAGVSIEKIQLTTQAIEISPTETSINTQSNIPTAEPTITLVPSSTPIPTFTPVSTVFIPTKIPPTQYITPTTAQPNSGLSNDDYYINVDGNKVHSPAYSDNVPQGATAKCRDGTYSFSQHRSGTCSGHGGVAEWL